MTERVSEFDGPTRKEEAPAPDGAGTGAGGASGSRGSEDDPPPSRDERKGGGGSWSSDDPDRPTWDTKTVLKSSHAYPDADGSYLYTVFKGLRADGQKAMLTGRIFSGGMSELNLAKKESPDDFYRHPGLEHVLRGKGNAPDLLYRLDELARDLADKPTEPVHLAEGEKDVDTLRGLGLIATTNPNGALSWKPDYNDWFRGRDVVIWVDNDPKGRERAKLLVKHLLPVARSLKVIELPDLPQNGDVTDWLEADHTKEELLEVVEATRPEGGVGLFDFYAFMPSHNYIFAASGEPWPASSVNARIPPVPVVDGDGEPVTDDDGKPIRVPANRWLDQNRPVEQMAWAPGHPQVVRDRLISDGGWIPRPGCSVFNQYRPPLPIAGDAAKAGRWLEHVRRVYPNDAEHMLDWLAHRVQRPEEKINHALVMGGAQGIGKDTILEPVKVAVGPWNFAEVSPQTMLGRFNGFVKSVILRVSEARDLGDVDRFAFYDHTKTYTAAPPDVLRVDEKHLREYAAFNVCGVIITTNHKGDGLYLPEDDRRHYVAWSDLTRDDFNAGYWQELWAWYRDGGAGHVAAYLASRDLSKFDAKAPPRKTDAFWEIVTANSAPEDADLTDALATLRWPDAVILADIAAVADKDFAGWLGDRGNARRIPHKMEECGYRPVRKPGVKSGRWKVNGRDVVIYARRGLSARDAIVAAEKREAGGPDSEPM